MSKIQALKSSTYVSLFFLVGFLIFWNFQNYKLDKRELYVDLSDQLELACSEYRDTLIDRIFLNINFDTTIDIRQDTSILIASFNFPPEFSDIKEFKESFPKLNNAQITAGINKPSTHIHSSTRQDTYNEGSELLLPETQDTAIHVIYDPVHPDRKVVVWKEDLSKEDLTLPIHVDTSKGYKLEIFYRDSLGQADNSDSIPLVYREINEMFTRRLINNKLIVNHELKMIDSSQLSDMTIAIPYRQIFTDQFAAVLFPSYQGFLLKKLLPSIGISILLLGIISLSLMYLLKSWIAQERLTKVRHEFVSNMTHELKTPISTIAVALEAMQKYGVLDDKMKRDEYLNISLHEAARLNILVDKVLKMSSLNDKDEMLSLVDLDIKSLTEEVLKSMQLHFEKHHVTLSYKSPEEYLWLKGDKVHLTNVIYNLIDNAIKYSDGEPELGVYLASTEKDIKLEITDKGRGIAAQDLSRIFDRFYRVPSKGERHDVKGHGLGLHYVKNIIEKHGGSIVVSSKLEQGTTFSISLPQKND